MKATPLNTKLRNSAFALALIGAASFLSGPASAGSSVQQDAMQNCPLQGRWAISVWSGQDLSLIHI